MLSQIYGYDYDRQAFDINPFSFSQFSISVFRKPALLIAVSSTSLDICHSRVYLMISFGSFKFILEPVILNGFSIFVIFCQKKFGLDG